MGYFQFFSFFFFFRFCCKAVKLLIAYQILHCCLSLPTFKTNKWLPLLVTFKTRLCFCCISTLLHPYQFWFSWEQGSTKQGCKIQSKCWFPLRPFSLKGLVYNTRTLFIILEGFFKIVVILCNTVDAPSLDAFKARLDVALDSLVWWLVNPAHSKGVET